MREGFRDQFNARIQPAIVHDSIARITGRKQNFKVGPSSARLIRQLPPIHTAWQPYVGEKDSHVRVGVEDRQRGAASIGFDDVVSQLPQRFATKGSDIRIIFDNQDRFGCRAASRQFRIFVLIMRLRRMDARKIKLDRSAYADLAIDLDMPTGLLGKAVNLRQSQAGAVPHIFCREKRIERFCLHVGGHSASRCPRRRR